MTENLYIGDLHIGHEKILWLDNRPFHDTKHMLAALIQNWNRAVHHDDTVYILGDMFWKMIRSEKQAVMEQLAGRKILISGNHDTDSPQNNPGFEAIYDNLTIQDGDDQVYLSHYPTIAFPNFYKGAVHLYAHVHNGFESNLAEHVKASLASLYERPCRMYNAGCMMPWMDYTPRTLRDIETRYKRHCPSLNPMARPEPQKILTLSTAHISGKTAEMLDREAELNLMNLCVYPKCGDRNSDAEDFGWFIYLPAECSPDVPDDLKRTIERARSIGCAILCLDTDGPMDNALNTYDW